MLAPFFCKKWITHLDVKVNFSTSTKVGKVAAGFKVSSPGIRVQFIHLLFCLIWKSTLIKNLKTQQHEVTHTNAKATEVQQFIMSMLEVKAYIHNGDRNIFYFVRLNVGVLAVQGEPGCQFTLVQALQLKI